MSLVVVFWIPGVLFGIALFSGAVRRTVKTALGSMKGTK
ncbi:hypothetical protein ADU37_CDS07020 [Thermococcus sp. 2319x1]|nr:hypothetical protein ADU37_CDS07020 [Thermococcus sp. 2319x1]